jgi:hypothetical protein
MAVAPSRTTRDTREDTAREESWKPQSLLPVPLAQEGYAYRWVRTSAMGQADAKNVSAKLREGWVPVKAEDHPELQITSDRNSTFPGCVEVGGLLLCKTAIENVTARNRYYAKRAAEQMSTVDNDYLRQADPRMPVSRPERRTRTTFGSGQ